jgi:nucleoside diphosphate kinase
MRMLHLSQREAEGFYAVHRERPFFGSLTQFMSEGRSSCSRWRRRTPSGSGGR